jgi:Fe-S-cluster-containing dehydrogenase component/DMSO reductase anchor subunit
VNSPVEDYLAEQGRLRTPVARFASTPAPDAGGNFTALIPLSAPTPGQQYAFEVDLDACTGCKACVAACHSLNGLDEHETWRDIGLLIGDSGGQTFAQTITTACHHCEDPGCLNGCPVLAYEKDSVTGIVRHLDDQCIGCSYCIFTCPYDVPKYNPSRGIVRKCDLCSERLSHGEAPACVQACPTHAIRITTVTVGAEAASADFLPGAPDPKWTRPTTRYLSSRPDVVWKESTEAALRAPEPAHWPLVLMTTLAGLGTASTALATVETGELSHRLWIEGAIAGVLGLAASVGHLGQPLRAWRIFLGLRRSWMSREAMLIGLWALGAGGIAIASGPGDVPRGWQLLVSAIGAAGLFCSAMIYATTPRPFWHFRYSGPRFLGGAVILAVGAALAAANTSHWTLYGLMIALLAGKSAVELWPLRAGDGEEILPLKDSARLLAGPLKATLIVRLAFAAAGAVLLAGVAPPLRAAGFGLLLVGEIAERLLFFRAVTAPRMPGVVHE